MARLSRLDSTITINYWPLRFALISVAGADAASEYATEIVAAVTSKYPPNASGLARALPWNWSVEPILPSPAAEAAFEWLSLTSDRIQVVLVRGIDDAQIQNIPIMVGSLIDRQTGQQLDAHMGNILKLISRIREHQISFTGTGATPLVISGFLVIFGGWFSGREIWSLLKVRPAPILRETTMRFYSESTMQTMAIFIYAIFFIVIAADDWGVAGFLLDRLLFFSPIVCLGLLFLFVRFVPWSFNPYLGAAEVFMRPASTVRLHAAT